MNTTAAAAEAHVTVATIRTWCRNGVVAAVKASGRWAIDAASLAHRIAIGVMRTRKATMTEPTFTLTDDKDHYLGTVAVTGPADLLRTAFETGTPITLSGAYAGERVYLGYTSCDWAGRPQGAAVGLDHDNEDGTATYLVNEDLDKLAAAPRVVAAIDAIMDGAVLAQVNADAADHAYLNSYYE